MEVCGSYINGCAMFGPSCRYVNLALLVGANGDSPCVLLTGCFRFQIVAAGPVYLQTRNSYCISYFYWSNNLSKISLGFDNPFYTLECLFYFFVLSLSFVSTETYDII